ncbi:MAG: hypothetical protein ACRDO7_18450 [Nocardioidaceae bacterium]
MPNWGMNPEPLHSAGGNISKLETDASSASKGFLDSVTDAGAAVHHGVVKGALDTYHGTWSTAANRLPQNVNAAGSQVQDAAVSGVQGDEAAHADLNPALSATATAAPMVTKSINAM